MFCSVYTLHGADHVDVFLHSCQTYTTYHPNIQQTHIIRRLEKTPCILYGVSSNQITMFQAGISWLATPRILPPLNERLLTVRDP